MTVEKLLIELELKTKNFKKQADEVKSSLKGSAQEAEKTTSAMERATQKIRALFGGVATSSKNVASSSKEYQKLETQIRKTVDTIKELEARQKALGEKGRVPTEEYTALQTKLQDLQKEYDKLSDLGDSWIGMGLDPASDKFQTLDKQLAQIDAKMDAVEKDMEDLEQRGGAFTPSTKFEEFQRKIDSAKESLSELIQKRDAMDVGGGGEGFSGFGEKVKGIGDRFKGMGQSAVKAFKDSAHNARMSFGRILKYALGLQGLFTLFRRLRASIKEGFNNLAQYSSRTAQDLAILKGSLTQVKNSLATAFAPIVTAIAPYIQTLVNYLTTATNAIAQFFASLTGQKTVTLATTGLGDVQAGATGVADATGSANESAKELQRTLMGFDQINKLDDTSSAGSGGGGGGGGVGAGAGFTTSEIDNVYSEWADKIKDAWKKADFTEIGSAVAEKLNSALESIPWDKIKETCNKIAKSVGTFINGFVKTTDWGLVAQTISNALETAMDTVTTLIQTIDWAELGKAVVKFIAGIDWAGLFKSASSLAGSIIGGIASFIGGAIAEAFKGIKSYFEKEVEEAGGDVVQGVFNGIIDAIANIGKWIYDNIFSPFIEGFKKAFGIGSPSTVMETQGGYIIQGLLNGITAGLSSIISWFKDLPSKIAEAVGDFVISVKAKVTEVKEDLKDKGIEMQAKINSYTKDEKFDSNVDMKARLTNRFTGKDYDDSVDMKARLTNRYKAKGYDSDIQMKAKLTKKDTSSLDKTVGGMTANLTKKNTSSLDKTVGYMTAKFYKKNIDNLDRTINMTANITKANWQAGNAVLEGNLIKFTKAGGGVFKNGKWQPVTTASTGGSFNTGQMFIAREAGPELVGTIGGHTAVMNNEQIVSSVADGVYRAVASAMSGSGDTNVHITLEGDLKKFFRAIQQEARNYTNSTGRPAFAV